MQHVAARARHEYVPQRAVNQALVSSYIAMHTGDIFLQVDLFAFYSFVHFADIYFC